MYDFVAALYFVAIALVAAIVGQVVIKKLVALSGRASVIIFILAFTLLVSGIALGKCHLENCLTCFNYSPLNL